MKKIYNPYTVPEGFFEQNRLKAVDGFKRRRQAIRYSLATLCAAAVLLTIPLFMKSVSSSAGPEAQETASANSLAQMYDYDIFLQVSF